MDPKWSRRRFNKYLCGDTVHTGARHFREEGKFAEARVLL